MGRNAKSPILGAWRTATKDAVLKAAIMLDYAERAKDNEPAALEAYLAAGREYNLARTWGGYDLPPRIVERFGITAATETGNTNTREEEEEKT